MKQNRPYLNIIHRKQSTERIVFSLVPIGVDLSVNCYYVSLGECQFARALSHKIVQSARFCKHRNLCFGLQADKVIETVGRNR